VLARRIAHITGAEGDVASAKAAHLEAEQQKALLNEHLLAQAKIDLAKLQALR
jgi:hypothetical protein